MVPPLVTELPSAISAIKGVVQLTLAIVQADTQAASMMQMSLSMHDDMMQVRRLRESAGDFLAPQDRDYVDSKLHHAALAFDDVGAFAQPLYADYQAHAGHKVRLGQRIRLVINKQEVHELLRTLSDAKASLLATMPYLVEAERNKRDALGIAATASNPATPHSTGAEWAQGSLSPTWTPSSPAVSAFGVSSSINTATGGGGGVRNTHTMHRVPSQIALKRPKQRGGDIGGHSRSSQSLPNNVYRNTSAQSSSTSSPLPSPSIGSDPMAPPPLPPKLPESGYIVVSPLPKSKAPTVQVVERHGEPESPPLYSPPIAMPDLQRWNSGSSSASSMAGPPTPTTQQQLYAQQGYIPVRRPKSRVNDDQMYPVPGTFPY